ncbi:hypothetical protein TWF696_000052 [Orbilia brochopaga]|uniref:Uncharacterized protein n=1 Tax=Orbilia brochopaga TaxID=3140254 RepID=A0AAV9VA51_9PEZI
MVLCSRTAVRTTSTGYINWIYHSYQKRCIHSSLWKSTVHEIKIQHKYQHRSVKTLLSTLDINQPLASLTSPSCIVPSFYKRAYSIHNDSKIASKGNIKPDTSSFRPIIRLPSMASTSTSDPAPSEPAPESQSESRYEPRYIDVGINLTDMMYQGFYHGRKVHEVDLENVIQRAHAVGCKKLMVTGSDYKASVHAVELAQSYPGVIFATVGVHPCSASELIKTAGGVSNIRAALKDIETLALEGKARGTVTAFGEIGLDYDRFYLSDQDSQLRVFEEQLRIAEKIDLPLFLHSRAAEEDFNRLLFAANLPRKGLVHSFTGTLEEMHTLVNAGFDIGINGCSLKTEENLAVVREVPLGHLQIETDGPWCEIRATHASAAYLKNMPSYLTETVPKDVKKERFQLGMRVKGRNEPCAIAGVAWVIAQVKGVTFEEVCERSWANSMNMFRYDEAAALQEAWAKENSNGTDAVAVAAGGDGA